jgi:hypothetical protein
VKNGYGGQPLKIIVINANWVFSSLMGLIRASMNAEAKKKFVYFSDDSYKQYLIDLFGSDDVPVEYGGTGPSMPGYRTSS